MIAKSRHLSIVLLFCMLLVPALACGKGGKATREPSATQPPSAATQPSPKGAEPTITSFVADDALVPAGGCTFLRWEVQNAEAVYINRHKMTGTSQEVCPAATTSYLLATTNDAGTARARVVVEVGEGAAAGALAEIVSFDADEPGIAAGACTILRWDVRGATAVTVDGQATTGTDLEVCPEATTTYNLVAESAAGPVTAQTTVEVGAAGASGDKPWIVSFDADEGRVTRGKCTILRWDVRGATGIALDGDRISGTNTEVCPKTTTVYELEANNNAGTSRAKAQVEVGTGSTLVTLPISIESFDADEPTITAGDCTLLRWDVRGADRVLVDYEAMTGTSFEVCPATSTKYLLLALDKENKGVEASTWVAVKDASGREVADSITNFAVKSEGIRTLAFSVDYRYISSDAHGAQVNLVAVPISSRTPLQGFSPETQSIRAGSGTATFRLTYAGDESDVSDQVALSMVDQDTGLPFALAAFELDKTWAAVGDENPDDLELEAVRQVTPGEYELDVDYHYSSNHGTGVRVGVKVTDLPEGADPSLLRAYPSDVLRQGVGTATLRVRYTGTQEVTTGGLLFYLWEEEAPRFYVEVFEQEVTWTIPLRDEIAITGVERRSGRDMVIPITYRYVSDHGLGMSIRVKLFSGETELGDFVCVECPTALGPSDEERSATLIVRYVGPGVRETTRIRVYFAEPEVPIFYLHDLEREWKWGGPLTVEGIVQRYANGGTNNCNDPDYSQPWPVQIVESYPYNAARAWTVTFSTREDCDGAQTGQTKLWTGILSGTTAGLVEKAVPGDEWHKSLVGTVTFRSETEHSVEIVTPTYWEPASEANQLFTVFFANAEDLARVGINDFISVDGEIGGKYQLKEATLDWTSPPRRRPLPPLPSADDSLTEATGFDLIAQVSREMLQALLIDEFEPIRIPWVMPDGRHQILILEEPALDLNGPSETAVLLLVPAHSEDNSLQFTLTLGANFLLSGLSSELKVAFSQPAVHTLRYQGRVYREQDLNATLQAAVAAAGAALSRVPISIPLDFVDDLIEDLDLHYGARPTPREWVPLVVPTDASGDGWVFLGATVANPFAYDWWWDVTRGDWRYVFDLTGGATNDGVAFALSDDLLNALIAAVRPPEPYAITFEDLGLLPITGSQDTWLGIEGYAAQIEAVSYNVRMLIVDDLPLEYAGGILSASPINLDLYAIDCAEIACYDNPDFDTSKPTVEDPGEPGHRAYSHGVHVLHFSGRLVLTEDEDGNPSLGLAIVNAGKWFDRSDIDIVLKAWNELYSMLEAYASEIPPALLNLTVDLPGSLGRMEAIKLEPHPKDTILVFVVR